MKRSAGVLAGIVAMLGVALAVATPAWAAPTTQVVQGEVLRLVSVADWQAAASLQPGERVRWDVEVSAQAPDPGTVRVGVSATGDAVVTLDAALCMRPWAADTCPSGITVLRAGWEIPRDGTEIELAEFADTEIGHLRLEVALAEARGSTDLRVHAWGSGEAVDAGPGGGLATTGMAPVTPWVIGGTAVLTLGVLLLVVAARRSRPDDEADSS